MGAHDFKLIKVPLFSQKLVNINVSLYAATKLALVPASRYYSDGTHDSKLNKVPFPALKSVNSNVSRFAAPKLVSSK